MASLKGPPVRESLGSRRYRLTADGEACLDGAGAEDALAGPLSTYLYDVLEMCVKGMWFEQLQQFMPPQSLDQSLRALLALGLIKIVEENPAACEVSSARSRKTPVFSALTRL